MRSKHGKLLQQNVMLTTPITARVGLTGRDACALWFQQVNGSQFDHLLLEPPWLVSRCRM
jgi:hypothetical protein